MTTNTDGTPVFESYFVSNWGTAKALLSALGPRYAFRGHSCSDWILETSLVREANRAGYPQGELRGREGWILEEFRRKAHHYSSDLPVDGQVLDWLALIRHYGGPTRLLDFTHSPYVAAFFACEQAQGDAAVWCIDLNELADAVAARFKLSLTSKDWRFIYRKHAEIFQNTFYEPPDTAGVLWGEPVRMNARLSAQQGLFLIPTHVDQSFQQNLLSLFDAPEDTVDRAPPDVIWQPDLPVPAARIIKVTLPERSHGNAIVDLRAMNITALSLFGGLEGLGRSLNWFLRPTEPAVEQSPWG